METKKPFEQPANTCEKKSYVAPTLVEYGTIAKLTMGGGSVSADGGGMLMA